MKHRRYSNKRLKQMMNEIMPEATNEQSEQNLVDKKNTSGSKKSGQLDLDQQQK